MINAMQTDGTGRDRDVEVPPDLLSALNALIERLPAIDVGTGWTDGERWAARLTASRRRIARGDPYGVNDLLAAFGGMGSFSDLYLDDDLDGLRSRVAAIAYETARRLGIQA
ncbi:hypothetical protein A5791_05660 [Mycobacterium sp. 852002-51163_SCH5372311]|nr:hypothetical protein A5791_05660 [Mycobacterium sp. 852002-51163_SCH5372311]